MERAMCQIWKSHGRVHLRKFSAYFVDPKHIQNTVQHSVVTEWKTAFGFQDEGDVGVSLTGRESNGANPLR